MTTHETGSPGGMAGIEAERAADTCVMAKRSAWPLIAFLPALTCVYALALTNLAGQPTPACTGKSAFTPFHPLPTFQQIGIFQADVDFIVGTGRSDHDTVFALWQDHGAGDLLAGLNYNGGRGIQLPGGI